MKLHRVKLPDSDQVTFEWVLIKEWLFKNVGANYYSAEYLPNVSPGDYGSWLFCFFYEEDKIKFILKWL